MIIKEEYSSSTEQMNQILKNAKSLQMIEEKTRLVRIEFIQSVLGKNTYKKFDNSGLFAPVPLVALKLTFKDFADLNTDFDIPVEKVEKMISYLHDKFYRYKDLSYSENHDAPIRTDIVFKTIDEIINFFYNLLSAFSKTYKTEEINWKPVVKKFRAYLN